MILALLPLLLKAQLSITVQVSDFISDEGKAHYYLFEEGQELSFSSAPLQHVKAPITNKAGRIVFEDVKPGTYAVMVFHDEDDNGEMKHYFFGPPKEGIGASNNPKGHAKFEDAQFELNKENLTFQVKMNYVFR